MKPLKILIPNICLNEQRYALDILLGEFLGLIFEVEVYEGCDIEITSQECVGKLTLDSSFFHKIHQSWLKPESMPAFPLEIWRLDDFNLSKYLTSDNIPVLYGSPGFIKDKNNWHLNLDIFGSAFFMLTRYEELLNRDRDEHGRFPDTESTAYKAGFLDRPIINEYLEILWDCMHELWPILKRKDRKFRKIISCDVDHPFDQAGYSFRKTIFRVGARLIRDINLILAFKDAMNYIFKQFNSDFFDEYRANINWIVEVNNQAGNKVAFYFIPTQTNEQYEDDNDIRSYKNSSLLRGISECGHEVGIHPGYNTFEHSENFTRSVKIFKDACTNNGIYNDKLGGRQHYLRYDIAKTPRIWEENGLAYDSSLGYASKPGFRSGICYEYSMFDIVSRESIKLKQRPLIVMESTIIAKEGENFGYGAESIERFMYFKNICKKYSGDFTLLWHNSYFDDRLSKSVYLNVIK
jgi:hypothetical protein